MKLNHKIFFVGIASMAVIAACTTPTTTSVKTNTVQNNDEYQDVFSNVLPERNVASGEGDDGKFFAEFNAIGPVKKLLKERLILTMGWVRSDPLELFAELRKSAPVFTIDSIPIKKFAGDKETAHPSVSTVLVTKNKDVVELLNQPTTFSVADYKRKIQDSVGPFMLATDGDATVNFKEKPWMREMMPREDEPKIKKMVHDLVNQSIADGTLIGTRPDGTPYARLEVVNALARRVPVLLTGKYFGFPGPSEAKMLEWSHATQDDFFHNVKNVKEVHDLAVTAGQEMHEYLKVLIEQKKRLLSQDPSKDDVLTRMLRSGHKELFTDDQIVRNIIGTLVGGVETTQAAVVQSLHVIMTHPKIFAAAQRAALAGDDKLLAKFVWEALRFDPVNPFVVRMAEQDYKLRDVMIKKGSVVLVATQSAMFDEEVVDHPNDFRLDRPDSVYFHLGYGHHRCLGDYVSLVQVPEIVKGVLTQPGLQLASGQAGKIIKTPVTGSFPESFVVEFKSDIGLKSPLMAGVDQQYAFEAYLQDYNRHDFRTCLRGEDTDTVSRVETNMVRHYVEDFHKRLLWCRLKPEFRACVAVAQLKLGFLIVNASPDHEKAMVDCKKDLTQAEEVFYRAVMLNQTYDITKVPTNQAHRTSGPEYDFEDRIKFYDRYTYAECFMNPLAPHSFPDDRDNIFYARLPMVFRDCMGKPVVANEYSFGKLGKTRAEQYQVCKNGSINQDTKKWDGELSLEEKFYYRTLILRENVTYAQVVREEQ